MAPKKPGTKGQKQIIQENASTLAFYRNMILIVGAIYLTASFLFFKTIPTLDRVILVMAALVYYACYRFMSSMSSPKFGVEGVMLDEGCDLNMEGGIAEHCKDLIILTSTCVALSTISTYFWLCWLLAPARAFQMVWANILSPYFFQPAPEVTPEVSEKKQRKMDKRMIRHR